MPDQVVPTHHCGTHAPGWLNGLHPTVAEGAVKRKVCFHWSSNPCYWYRDIRVRNCGGYYVYELWRTPTCHLRYCGNNDLGQDFFMFTLLFSKRSYCVRFLRQKFWIWVYKAVKVSFIVEGMLMLVIQEHSAFRNSATCRVKTGAICHKTGHSLPTVCLCSPVRFCI